MNFDIKYLISLKSANFFDCVFIDRIIEQLNSSSSPRPVPTMLSPHNNNGNGSGKSPLESGSCRRTSRRGSGAEPRTSSPSVYHVSSYFEKILINIFNP